MRRVRVLVRGKCNNVDLARDEPRKFNRVSMPTRVPARTVKIIKCLFLPTKQIGRSLKSVFTPAAAAFVTGMSVRKHVVLLNRRFGSASASYESVTKRRTALLMPSAPRTTSACAVVPSWKWMVVAPSASVTTRVQRLRKCVRAGSMCCTSASRKAARWMPCEAFSSERYCVQVRGRDQ